MYYDDMMNFDALGLNYEVHLAGIDGECFMYSVYFENGAAEEKNAETKKAVREFVKPYSEKDIYLGYIDVSKDDDKVSIFLDLGNTEPEYQDEAINGILKALNNVSGVKTVIINEDSDLDL